MNIKAPMTKNNMIMTTELLAGITMRPTGGCKAIYDNN